jgi:hypothetical protein
VGHKTLIRVCGSVEKNLWQALVPCHFLRERDTSEIHRSHRLLMLWAEGEYVGDFALAP